MKKLVLIQVVVAIVFGFVSTAQSAPEWQVTLWVTQGSGKAKLELGVDSTATDGYDKVWDSYTMLGGSLRAYFPRPDWHPVFQNYWRDIRAKALGNKSDWTFIVDSDTPNTDIYVTWDLSTVPADHAVTLVFDEATGQSLDMRSTSFYGFPYSAPKNMRVSVEAPAGPSPYQNQPPAANAGPDQMIELASCDGATVTLDGRVSSDPDGDPLTYLWTWDGGQADGATPTVTLPIGTTVVTLTVTDTSGLSSTDSVQVRINDTISASLAVEVSPSILWPPDHKLIRVVPRVSVGYACAPKTRVELLSVVSNEPEKDLERDEEGRKDEDHDIFIEPVGSIMLRAERSARGSGRIYTITYVATNTAGHKTVGSAQVVVPVSKPKNIKDR